MKTKHINPLAIALIVLLSGCYSGLVGTNFFIRNHEDQAISIHYKYYNYDNYYDSINDYDKLANSNRFVYPPKPQVLLADTLLNNKLLGKQYLQKSTLYFDTAAVNFIDSLNYQFNIPAKSTVSLAQVYYGDNIEYIILNELDTIKFKHEPPYVENLNLFDQRLAAYYNGSSLGYGYYLVELYLDDILESFIDQ